MLRNRALAARISDDACGASGASVLSDIAADAGQNVASPDSRPQLKMFSKEEVARHRTEEDAWISVFGKAYDVTDFLHNHPGGPEVILESMQGKDVGDLMKGVGTLDAHSHSQAAFDMLQQFHVGGVANSSSFRPHDAVPNGKSKPKSFTVDLNKPLVFQVGHLGEDYQKWVHQPIVSKESPRFFASDFCEYFTRTVWWIIPIVWVPVVLFMQRLALQRGLELSTLPRTFLLGVLLWSFLEYSLHRFLFHIKTSTYWGNTLHYLLHGCHHKHPMDGYRLVFPPVFTALFCAVFWGILKALCPYTAVPSVFGGGLLGYVVYDVTHYFLHHGAPFSNCIKKLKRYHLNHHFKVQTDGFGITSPLWDRVFGTVPMSGPLGHSFINPN